MEPSCAVVPTTAGFSCPEGSYAASLTVKESLCVALRNCDPKEPSIAMAIAVESMLQQIIVLWPM